MEIGTGSSDNGSLRDESSGFDRVQRRSNESRDGINKRDTKDQNNLGQEDQKGSEHRVNKRGCDYLPTNLSPGDFEINIAPDILQMYDSKNKRITPNYGPAKKDSLHVKYDQEM
ncbi:hypothetical protein TNCV_2579731 [Trichonephila clavipes]|uniref:Uncharacterized protein n=1 Tax=Trichonephila clavipes TaxID=2585209 RepID=A0A8X6SGE2_TRICX|nr:hypothetical protein TNCV_2579731 [Trichonephila clavipes]